MNFWRDESGATAIEYGLICGLIFVAIVAGFMALGGSGHGLFSKIGTAVAGI